MKKFALILSAAIFSHSGVAQYAIDWHKIAGGGGASSNGQYTLIGTIGQHDASGSIAGGAYTLNGGFWTISTTQTKGSPLLQIAQTGANLVKIFWPSPSAGYALQMNPDLGTTNWVPPLEIVNDDGTNKFILVMPASGNHFYRLIGP